jgi:phosphoribosylformimino-5-aminoimidazole carboxamide ribotide isomerase
MLLIPSIDLRGGRCVRLREGDFATETAYAMAPAALVRRYHALGARWLHIVDLDGARDGVTTNLPIIESLLRHPAVCYQVGGGVRSAAMIEKLLSMGVARVVIGSAAIERPAEVARWLKCFGKDRICLAFDVRMGVHQPQVHTHGWTRNSVLTLWDAINAYPPGLLKHVLSTDIERDGTLRGPNLALYRYALNLFPHLAWQASGGIRNATDLAALARLNVAAAVSGKALIEEHIPLEELRRLLPAALSPA